MAGLLRGPKKYHLKRNPTQRWHLLRLKKSIKSIFLKEQWQHN